MSRRFLSGHPFSALGVHAEGSFSSWGHGPNYTTPTLQIKAANEGLLLNASWSKKGWSWLFLQNCLQGPPGLLSNRHDGRVPHQRTAVTFQTLFIVLAVEA
eukprot:TRINITY_DN183_c0_g1_i1.p1 TRINITY_DN183_c0_g1~~TRINITY_DN183_c0_g1_i1.p1  ORF type:complete len:101 (+),score=6.20 TRINITY_DN183_c0_g1_i1:535-837(+)